jgi:glycosyltransferase involved in cell wall biosynthesis
MTTGMEHNVRKVLMVAYTFPPMGGSGVQRTVKFAKYLPEFGWHPVILTVSNPSLREADVSLLEELPIDLPVYRTPDGNLPDLLRRTARKIGLISSDGRHAEKTGSDSSILSPPAKSQSRTALSRFADVWLQIPDQFIYWLPTALRVGLRVVKQCDVIYSTSDPFTDHIVAVLLHALSGKPWVADFRDPWTQYVTYQRWSSRLRSRVDVFFEKRLLKIPDVVSVTCAATAKSFQEICPSLPKDKFIEITNGFDAEDFQLVCSPFDRFTIAYTGRFHGKKNTSHSFLRALGELRRECPELVAEIQVLFAGMFEEECRTLLKQWDLEEMARPLGYVSHRKSVELLLKSHVLLLTLNDEPGVNLTYPGKLFEYLAAEKTILALVPAGATADLIRDMEAGLVIAPDDIEAIKRAVLDLYGRYKRGETLPRTRANLQRFERRTLTERLAQCLDGLL